MEYFEDIEEYCVSVEKHKNGKLPFHIHVYLCFKSAIAVTDLHTVLDVITDYGYDVQPCRSRKSVLKYITKEDEFPFFNCSE